MGLPSAASVRAVAVVGPAARVKSGSRMGTLLPLAGAGPCWPKTLRLLSTTDVWQAQGRGEIGTPGKQDECRHDRDVRQHVDDVAGDVDAGELECGADGQADAEDEGG